MADLRKVKLVRFETDDFGTFGKLSIPGLFECYTGEDPWRDNEPDFSCILPAPNISDPVVINGVWLPSTRWGECYHLQGVEGRSACEIHKGNFCGDKKKNIKSDVEGCIILGNAIGVIGGQKALLSSKDAYDRFLEMMDKQPFTLSISWGMELK